MKKGFTAKFKAAALFCAALLTAGTAYAAENADEWDKTFPKSGKVEHSKVTFRNRYGITLKADLYKPKGAQGRLAAIAVCGPFGAVKEQASGLYAQTMAERGFLTIAFDPSCLRPVVHGRERRRAALHGVARHQHGGLHGGGGLSLRARRRGPR